MVIKGTFNVEIRVKWAGNITHLHRSFAKTAGLLLKS